MAALAITEPGAGSDVAGLRTHAAASTTATSQRIKDLHHQGVRADVLVCAVRTKPEGGHQGISFLLIDKGDGVSARPLRKLGWRARTPPRSPLTTVRARGEPARPRAGGFSLIMANFQWERLLMALGAVGAMQACFEQTVAFVRRDGLRPGQAVRHRLAEIAVEIEAGRDVTYHALRLHLAGRDAVREVTVAKLRTQRAAYDVIDACLSLHGLDAPPSSSARSATRGWARSAAAPTRS